MADKIVHGDIRVNKVRRIKCFNRIVLGKVQKIHYGNNDSKLLYKAERVNIFTLSTLNVIMDIILLTIYYFAHPSLTFGLCFYLIDGWILPFLMNMSSLELKFYIEQFCYWLCFCSTGNEKVYGWKSYYAGWGNYEILYMLSKE